jgi:N utilization substance protein A
MVVTFDTETIRLIALFENMTGVSVKDCLINNDNNTVYFLIEEGKAGIVIGKNGCGIKRSENLIKKKIKIFEFSADLNTFIKNLIPQSQAIKIKNESEKVVVEIKVDKKDKAMVIGRDGKNQKILKELLGRNYKIFDLIIR